MFGDTELLFLTGQMPNKSNPDPNDPSKIIKCEELTQRYFDCKENLNIKNQNQLRTTCKKMKATALLCFKLEKTYFLEAINKQLDEDSYLDLFIQKQLLYKTEPKSV